MDKISFIQTADPLIPAYITAGSHKTPVWIQSEWTEGEFSQYIRRNGCGHCCTAMAARLRGVDIDPYQEYLLCRELWGEPNIQKQQDHFLTVAGIQKILTHLGISARCYGVAKNEQKQAVAHILSSLQAGKLVIFVSDPFRDTDNIFSTGYHYVMAVGFAEKGKIVIANSSEKISKGGVQLVAPEKIENALYQGGTADESMTWGIVEQLDKGCTYVVVD